ncbi:hypothetical protein AB0B28_15960 [Glycomyces sp. NPDC046736]|uniref:hypothetical protein n=1 Tax=Glycomyces sp. NPDC046736 TaxID=3155615 RepID=UPI0033FDB573
MGLGRSAPHRARARYAKALKEIPLPVRSFTGVDPSSVTVIGETEISDRTLHFGVITQIPRLWILAPGHVPPVVGFLTGLRPELDSEPDSAQGTSRIDLHITELDHLDWASHPGRAARIKREALAAWTAAHRTCEG